MRWRIQSINRNTVFAMEVQVVGENQLPAFGVFLMQFFDEGKYCDEIFLSSYLVVVAFDVD
jgi:hypothetical protein